MIIRDIETKEIKDDTHHHFPYLLILQEICNEKNITYGAGESVIS